MKLLEIPARAKNEWETAQDALQDALEYEEMNALTLEKLRDEAEKAEDAALEEFVVDELLNVQVADLAKKRSLLSIVSRMTSEDAILEFDRFLLNGHREKLFDDYYH